MPTVPNPQMEMQRVSNSPAIMHTRDLMAKQNLIKTKQTHQLKTHNNTPGWIPAIQHTPVVTIPASDAPPPPPRQLPWVATREQHDQPVMFTSISGKLNPLAPTHIISQTALSAMTMKEALYVPKHSLTMLSSLLYMLIMSQTMRTMHPQWYTRRQVK